MKSTEPKEDNNSSEQSAFQSKLAFSNARIPKTVYLKLLQILQFKVYKRKS